jgi:SAM-dependent methyltransferase
MRPVAADYFVIAEAEHELQNPTSEEKLLFAGRRLGLGPTSHVLDIASGRGGPAVLLASTFGCSVEGIELRPEFHAAAVARADDARVSDRVSFELGDAAGRSLEPESSDVVLCLGATFVWRDLSGTLDALAPAVRPGGHVVVGEPFWRTLPLPHDYPDREAPYTTLADTVLLVELSALAVVSVIASSQDDWDRYETLHWLATERWLAEHPSDGDAERIRAQHERFKETYLRYGRDYLGWAIFVGWKRA